MWLCIPLYKAILIAFWLHWESLSITVKIFKCCSTHIKCILFSRGEFYKSKKDGKDQETK